jgi:hypothetical protein
MAAQVCKEWNRLCSDDIIWREIYRRLRSSPLCRVVSCRVVSCRVVSCRVVCVRVLCVVCVRYIG